MRLRPSARHLTLFFVLFCLVVELLLLSLYVLVYVLNVCEIPKPTRISVVRHLTFIDFIQALPAKRHIKCNFHIVNVHVTIICSALFPVTNIELLNATITITHDILSSVWCFLRAFFSSIHNFCCCNCWITIMLLKNLSQPVGNWRRRRKKSHQYRFLYVFSSWSAFIVKWHMHKSIGWWFLWLST